MECPDVACLLVFQETANPATVRSVLQNRRGLSRDTGFARAGEAIGQLSHDRRVPSRNPPGGRELGKLPGVQRAEPSLIGIFAPGILASRKQALKFRKISRHSLLEMVTGRATPDP